MRLPMTPQPLAGARDPACLRGGAPAVAPSVARLPGGRAGDLRALALDFLAQRHSVGPKHLGLPAPSTDELARAAAVAGRAPDHRQLEPCRWVNIRADQRDRLSGLFAADAAARGHGAAEVERARERAGHGPALLAMVVRVRDGVEDVPAHEQWLAAGGALMNLLNALHLMGYCAKVLSGASVRSSALQAAFCRPGETLVAWVVAGTPTDAPKARAGPIRAGGALLTDW